MLETTFRLPITEPVAFFTLMLGIILLVPMLFERLKLPGLVGLILAGVLIGPNGLHLVNRGNTVVLLATIGLLYVMFIAGLEIDMVQFKRYRQRSLMLGVLAFSLPLGLGSAAGLAMGFGWMGSLLLGAVLASQTLVAYPIVSRLGLGKRQAVTTAVGGTIVTDTLALLVLSVVASGARGQLDVWFWLKLLGSLATYTAGVVWLVPRLARAFLKDVGARREQEFLFVLAVMFAVSLLAKVAGIEAIVGAFLAGLTLNRFLPEHGPLTARVLFVGNAVFIPFFLLATGMLVDVRALAGAPSSWLLAIAMIGIAGLGKFLASWLTGARYGYTPAERLLMFGLTMPQAAATLAVTLTGLKLGLFSMATVNAVVLLILVTCIAGSGMVQRQGRKLVHEEAPERVEDAPERILVPFANPASAEPLMDLALALRGSHQAEPIIPLMVVQPASVDVQAQVAQAEKHLAHAAMHAAGVDVPVAPRTRLGLNVPAVIREAIAETRSSLLVMGWNGDHSLKAQIFGNVIDQVIASVSSTAVVARQPSPLVTATDMVLIVPPNAELQPGFNAALRLVTRLADRLAKPMTVWESGSAAPEVMRSALAIAPQLELAHRCWPDWQALTAAIETPRHAETLFVLLSARRDDVSWDAVLETLPRVLAERPERRFLVVYPPELAEADEATWGTAPLRAPDGLPLRG